ncbi:MAG: hypothetical protein WD016_03130 [Balneolaceae bacterium]
MAKPKAKSLQQRLGFFDEDLKKPDHDSILKWLDKNIDSVLNNIYNFREWNKNHIKDLQSKALIIKSKEMERMTKLLKEKDTKLSSERRGLSVNQERLKKDLEEEMIKEIGAYKSSDSTKERIQSNETQIFELENEIPRIKEKIEWLKGFNGLKEKDLPERKKPKVSNLVWEYTITSQNFNPRTGYQSNKSVIGFIDMKVEFSYTQLCMLGLNENEELEEFLTWGQTEYDEDNSREILSRNLLIEVKTKIPSLGELFRQLNTYREYEKGDFLVVCPDDSEIETIKNQGFLFYKYEPLKVNK